MVTLCYTRHETAPGTHVDIPHEHERHNMSEEIDEKCTPSFGQLVYSSDCERHERCEATMQGIPIRCILTAGHAGDHK